MIEGSIQEEITLINIYTTNTATLKYMKKILMGVKGKINSNTIIVGDFNTPLISMDRSSRQKISTKQWF